ncbi:aldose 1-epimerase family protein [Nocardioides endophyticus]|uniref:Aldose 1-epimerase family protein n=1 Tax=Nocardioides endophyticus TaxID=1353775 RepID=A0ABP8Z4U9_9ACTN
MGLQHSPSGDQYVITHGDSRAVITRVGATLRSYTVAGHDVIDGFDLDERATDGRGQVLAPWPNRLTDGRYQYGGRDCQAPLNEVERHDAIHGLVRWLDWTLVDRAPALAALACALRPQPGYEWRLDLQVVYALGDAGLTVTFQAVNLSRESAPFGVGFHPYLTLGTPTIDGLDLMIPGAVASGSHDFQEPHGIGSIELDHAFGDLAVGPDGRSVARLTDQAHERSVELWVDQAYRYLMVYTGDLVAEPTRRRTAVAIEPMTCPPDAFRTGEDLIELEPGKAWQGSWGIRSVQA